jgi:P-type conjugative transfer protein TrbJ
MWLRLRAALVSIVFAGPMLSPPKARAVSAFAGALEPTQVANFIQLVEHTIHFIQMVRSAKEQVQHWRTTMQTFKEGDLRMATNIVRTVGSLVRQYRGVTFAARSNIETFKRQHPGHTVPPNGNYQQAYRDLDRDTLRSVERALKTMDVQLSDPQGGIEAEQRLINDLAQKARSADGQLKALQVTNELLVTLNHQVQKLRITLTAHAQQMAHYTANEVQRRAYDSVARERYFERRAPTHPATDWSREGVR